MSARSGVLPKVITLIPLAALSTVATVDAARIQPTGLSVASPVTATSPPSDTSPTTSHGTGALPAPEELATSRSASPAASGATKAVVASATTADIPEAATAAYQRAATVIDTADRTCRLDWTLLAAVGRVESDHGRSGGNGLSADGVATPGVVGPALNGHAGTQLVEDTDGGAYDGDTRFDHAVGPMQFLPSTWSIVGVDADGDGRRDPQDVDDAALAAAVYLCSGDEDLSAAAGQQAALLRYNRSSSYVDTVLGVARAYSSDAGLFGAVPASYVVTRAVRSPGKSGESEVSNASSQSESAAAAGHHKHPHRVAALVSEATEPVASAPAPTQSSAHPVDPVPSGTTEPEQPTEPTPEEPTEPTVASAGELTTLCTDEVEKAYPDATEQARTDAVAACVEALTGTTVPDATDQAPAVVADLRDTIDGLEPAPEPTTEPTTEPGTPAADETPEAVTG